MSEFIFKNHTHINAPLDDVFAFFSKAENLQKLTPEWLHFKILTSLPLAITRGTIIDYRIKLAGIPFLWKTEITNWTPPHSFTDTQQKGPYKKWVHQHRFIAQGANTLMADKVVYEVPGGPFAKLINTLFVRRQVSRIFKYREEQITRLF